MIYYYVILILSLCCWIISNVRLFFNSYIKPLIPRHFQLGKRLKLRARSYFSLLPRPHQVWNDDLPLPFRVTIHLAISHLPRNFEKVKNRKSGITQKHVYRDTLLKIKALSICWKQYFQHWVSIVITQTKRTKIFW